MKTKLEDGKNYEVYKVQRSMFNSEGSMSFLMYNQKRDECFETVDPRLCQELYKLCKEPKYYVAGKLERGRIRIEKVLEGEWF